MENLVNRVKQILVSPKTEWQVIDNENDSHVKVFMGYVLPLALIPAIASLIGYWVIGTHGLHLFSWGLRQAIVQFILMVGGVYITAFVINALAPTFQAQGNPNKAFSLVAYAYTPAMVAGIFYIIPLLSPLVSLVSLYSLYLLYIGLQPLMKQPAEKTPVYFVASLVAMVVAFVVLSIVLGIVLLSSAAMTGFRY
ncbi:MAG: YIP1 family protein [Dysgonamonadaceae bacterium]|jgi:hypothetical protein|nr:YIP1 family protein [Dysgonamonadaceae bacterium]